MKEIQAIVQRVRILSSDYYQLELAVPDYLSTIKPGQCLLARPKSMRISHVWHPYLREVWYPTHISNNKLTVEIKSREHFEPGDVIDMLGPVGQHYRLRRSLRNVLLIAYHTPPFPLTALIPQLLGSQVSVTLVLLGTATSYPTAYLPPEIEIIRGDNPDKPLEWQNQVTTIGWADQVFVTVPPGSENTYFREIWQVISERRAEIGQYYLYGVFQSVTPCGVGACEACMVRTNTGNKLACVDGPAFDLSEIISG